MSQTLTISDQLHARLTELAQKRGLNSVEQLLEVLPIDENTIQERQEAVRQINTLRERLLVTYGEMPDSTPLLRNDRGR